MRKELRARCGRRGRFSATFKRFGLRRGGRYAPVQTALFVDVRDESGEIVADHLWFVVGDQIRRLNLEEGDEVFFVARVTKYWKRNPEWIDDDDPPRVQDYRLSYPSQMQKLGVYATQPLPLFDEVGE